MTSFGSNSEYSRIEWTKWNLRNTVFQNLKRYGLLKAVFSKSHLVHSWILCPICAKLLPLLPLQVKRFIWDTIKIYIKWLSKILKGCNILAIRSFWYKFTFLRIRSALNVRVIRNQYLLLCLLSVTVIRPSQIKVSKIDISAKQWVV